MRNATLTFVLLVAQAGFLSISLYAQPNPPPANDPWSWYPNTSGTCWVPNSTPSRQNCYEYWQAYFNSGHNIVVCQGICDELNGLGCHNNVNNQFFEIGPDYVTWTSYFRARTLPTDPAGNQGRYRALQCVQKGNCLCINDGLGTIDCVKDTNSQTYDSWNLYEGDLNGAACATAADHGYGSGSGGYGPGGSGGGGYGP